MGARLKRREQIMARERLVRLWNETIMPNFVVTAVDERQPEYPWDVRIKRGREVYYPQRVELLSDIHFIRYQRLRFEKLVRNDYPPSVTIEDFAASTAEFIEGLKNEDLENGEFIVPFYQKILEDFQSDPFGLDHLRN